MKSKVFIKKMSTYWSLTSKIFTFVYFPFGKCESAPSLNNPVVQEKGQWFATGARHLFQLRLALNFIGQCALYYPPWGSHTLFPPLRILGADNGDLGWPDYPPLHLPGRTASELRGKYMCVVDTGDTMDTRHAPKPTTALYWLPPKMVGKGFKFRMRNIYWYIAEYCASQ